MFFVDAPRRKMTSFKEVIRECEQEKTKMIISLAGSGEAQ